MSRKAKHSTSQFSFQFIADLVAQAKEHPAAVRRVRAKGGKAGYRRVEVDIDTSLMPKAPDGLAAHDVEPVVVWVPPTAMTPPLVTVEHTRFVGVPHALPDGQLCIYLDPAREWDPADGAGGFLHRLYDWFEKAVGGQFDPTTALFHAVGGLPHFTHAYPVIVCREDLDLAETLSFAWLMTVNERRIDLRNHEGLAGSSEKVLVVKLARSLSAGPGASLRELLLRDGMANPLAFLEAWRQRVARRCNAGHDTVHVVFAVPNVNGLHHLLVGRLSLQMANASRDGDLPLAWCPTSDERPSISQRRDVSRPVSAFLGRRVALIGCGGLGSWIAEYLVRAGVAAIELIDYGRVSGGLLVRQNFADADVAVPKSEALAQRLTALAPDCDVTFTVGSHSQRLGEVLQHPDALVVDTTVSKAMALRLDALSNCTDRMATIAQVATDVKTGSLGMVVISTAGQPGPLTIDVVARSIVESDGRLEHYRTFWDPHEEDEMIPALGCSVPTYHGSGADLAAVAAEQVNLIARHLNQGPSGTHLFALPHSGIGPALHFIPYR